MKKIIVFIPIEEKEKVKNAMFTAGAGSIGAYEKCCFETLGRGQFLPKSDASPYIGKVGELTFVDEIRVEMVCEDHFLKDTISALKATHPYETPAFDVMNLVTDI